MKINFKTFILYLLILSACIKQGEISSFVKVNDKKWLVSDSLKYNFNNIDIKNKHYSQIIIKHKTDYYFQNLILFVNVNDQLDTLNLTLAKKNGSWIGKGVGDTRYYSKKLDNLTIKDTKSVSIIINHAMRNKETNQIKELQGICSIGFKIIKDN